MPRPAITFEALPASFGDCLLVTCAVGRRSWRMLVDTGPDETYPALRKRLRAIRPNRAGRRRLDLFVVSHIDHDHIGGARLLLQDEALRLDIGDIWFNAPLDPRARGVAEGQSLAELLGADGADARLPWNVAFGGRSIVAPAAARGPGARADDAPRLTVLSPTPDRLDALAVVWARELERLRRREREPVEPGPARAGTRGLADLPALASIATPTDRSVPNGSSIALLLEHRGASVLLTGDAFPGVLLDQLAELARQRGGGPLAVDIFKLSHHGSAGNTTEALVQAVPARHYVVSTDGKYFGHPDPEAIARVITGADQPTLWFTHRNAQNRAWGEASLRARYGHQVRVPARAGSRVTIRLDGA